MNRSLLAWLQKHTLKYGIPTLRDPSTPFYKKTIQWLFSQLIDTGNAHDKLMYDIPGKYKRIHYDLTEYNPGDYHINAEFYDEDDNEYKLKMSVHNFTEIEHRGTLSVPFASRDHGFSTKEYPIMISLESGDQYTIERTYDIIRSNANSPYYSDVLQLMLMMSVMFDAMLTMIGYPKGDTYENP